MSLFDQPVSITTEDLDVYYGDLHALRGIDLSLPENRITALIGASGSGKSTYLRSLNRMLDTIPAARVTGKILFRNQNILETTTDVIAHRRSVGMVFQNPTPFPKSIYDNIAYGLAIQGIRPKRQPALWQWKRPTISADEVERSNDQIDRAVVQSLREAALWDEVKDRLHESAYSLSGGQQQRLCIARAIAIRPQVLLLDEPCSALDPISTHKIELLLLELKQKYTIVIVTHNLYQARRISDYVGFFHMGKLMEFGATPDIFANAREQITREYVRGDFG